MIRCTSQLPATQNCKCSCSGEGAEEEEEEEEAAPARPVASGAEALSAAFFSQYDDPSVHQPLLQDSVYVGAWRQAIAALGPHIKDKIVLDVGCGPGLLAMLCANAGAKAVVAVDGSATMAEVAKQVRNWIRHHMRIQFKSVSQ